MQKLASERTESKDLGSETEGDESSESSIELVVCRANATLLLPRLVARSRLPFINCEKCGQLRYNRCVKFKKMPSKNNTLRVILTEKCLASTNALFRQEKVKEGPPKREIGSLQNSYCGDWGHRWC